MPIHDWTRVKAGKFHDFHQDWIIEIRRALNGGLLPAGYSAETDQQVLDREPDIVAISSNGSLPEGGVAVATAPPRATQVARIESETATYARKANRLAIRLGDDTLVAIIEVLSPGNKDGKAAIESFKSKVVGFLRNGINVVLIDLFPPSRRDPEGIHQLIWDELTGEPFEAPPADKPLTVASYDANGDITAYVNPVAIGDRLPDAPLFLAPGWYIDIPLEQTYMTSWSLGPKSIRDLFERH
jgi:hypothetical protein